MLYTVANEGWSPGSPLPSSPRRAGLYRTRSEAESVAPGCPLLAVAVRYDAGRGVITLASPASAGLPCDWSAPAIVGPSGGVTALASIPPALVRAVGKPRLTVHEGHRLPGLSARAALPSRASDTRLGPIGVARGSSIPDTLRVMPAGSGRARVCMPSDALSEDTIR